MAVLKSKQLSSNLTGSYILSGSSQTLHGTTTIYGTTTVSGSLTLKGSSVDLNIRQDDNTNIARLLTTTAGESTLKLYDNANHGSAVETININTSDTAALTIKSGSSTIFTVDRDNTLISGSSTSTGSFGRVETAGNINASGNVRGSRFEIDGSTDYIDQAFGDLFIVTTGDIGAQPGTNKALKVTGGISATSHITASGNLEAAGNISGSVTSTGSFGTLETSGVINATGRIFENGTSVIDHATAMAIVFGG